MHTTFRRRLAVVGFLALLFLVIYGIARSYSDEIVVYVVRQALIQKIPDGMDSRQVQKRFESLLAATSADSKLLKLMSLSSYLEKVQKLTPGELDRLLDQGGNSPGPAY
jgi:hypothetical protein